MLVQLHMEIPEEKCYLLLFFWDICPPLLKAGRMKNSVTKLTRIKVKIDAVEGKKEETSLTGAVAYVLLKLSSLSPFYLTCGHVQLTVFI